MTTPGASTRETWPLWEVFVRAGPRTLATCTPARCTPRRRARAAQRPRPLHTAGEGTSSGSSPPTPSRRATPTRRARSSRARQARTTAHAVYYTASEGVPHPVSDRIHGEVDRTSGHRRAARRELCRSGGHARHPSTSRSTRCGSGDDALILAQQLGAWIARAPELEEDVALANIALDLLGHARSLLRYAGTYDGRTEDDLAYWRDEPEFRSAWLFEQPNGDFAQTIARQLAASVYLFELYTALQGSADATLAAIAAKAVKEVEYHRDHAVQWTLRLADGTDESRRRMIRAVRDVWPYVDELFRDEPLTDRLGRRSRSRHRRCARRSTASSTRCSPRRGWSVLPTSPRPAAGVAGRTSRRWDTCSPRCRSWPGAIRGDMVSVRTGDRGRMLGGGGDAAVPDPEVPVLTIEDLGVLARRSRSTAAESW